MDDDKVYALVIYDIVDNRRREKFAKTLNKYGIRVQKSAFEVWIHSFLYKKMVREAMKIADKENDSIRIYKLQNDCKQVHIGKNPVLQKETYRWF